MSSSKGRKENQTLNEEDVEILGEKKVNSGPVWKPRFSLAKLSDSNRKSMILQHRKEIGSLGKMYARSGMSISRGTKEESRIHFTSLDTINPGGKENFPSNFSKLKRIELKDMDPYGYYSLGNMIELEIIEDAMSFSRVMLMAQDSCGDVIFVALYCDTPSIEDDDLQEKIGYGCKISIANPWMKIALDGRVMIRVEDNASIFIHKLKDPKKCRFCANPKSQQKCGRCKKAFYCSRDCQAHDWKLLNHKEICDAYVWVNNQIQN